MRKAPPRPGEPKPVLRKVLEDKQNVLDELVSDAKEDDGEKHKAKGERRDKMAWEEKKNLDFGYLAARVNERAKVRQFYRKLPPTEEWAENNYYKLPIERQNADLAVSAKGNRTEIAGLESIGAHQFAHGLHGLVLREAEVVHAINLR